MFATHKSNWKQIWSMLRQLINKSKKSKQFTLLICNKRYQNLGPTDHGRRI